MASPNIKFKRSSVAGKSPSLANIELGEIAMNTFDGDLYIRHDQSSVGVATTVTRINPWNEPNGVGAGISYSGNVRVDELTVGNYDFPTTVGSEGLVLKVASDGNLEFGSGASGGVVPTEETFTATQGQTVFTASSSLPTYIQIFINGVKIRPTTDFSKSGASVTLVSAATLGDEIDIVRFD
tara:strand:+ start:5627 stop:6172 length:546 start_codon:yes stop_codon:yes gene_type:complete